MLNNMYSQLCILDAWVERSSEITDIINCALKMGVMCVSIVDLRSSRLACGYCVCELTFPF